MNTSAFTQSNMGDQGKVLSRGVTQSDSGLLDDTNARCQTTVKDDCKVLSLSNCKQMLPLDEVGKTVWRRFVTNEQVRFGHVMLGMSIKISKWSYQESSQIQRFEISERGLG